MMSFGGVQLYGGHCQICFTGKQDLWRQNEDSGLKYGFDIQFLGQGSGQYCMHTYRGFKSRHKPLHNTEYMIIMVSTCQKNSPATFDPSKRLESRLL